VGYVNSLEGNFSTFIFYFSSWFFSLPALETHETHKKSALIFWGGKHGGGDSLT